MIDAEMVQVTARTDGANGGDAGLKLREKGDGTWWRGWWRQCRWTTG
jgi:hypothetical protein